MEFRVEVTPRAQQDLARIYDWVLSSAPIAGLRWFERFESSILSLANFPQRCPVEARLSSPRQTVRKLLFGTTRYKYCVYFTFRREVVTVLHIRHTFNKRARDPFETCVLRRASLLEVFVLGFEVRVYPSLMR